MVFKKPELKTGTLHIKCPECFLYKQLQESSNRKNPVFSFQYLQPGYGIKDCSNDDKIALLNKVYELSQLTWQDINQSHRHGVGKEVIPQEAIHPAIPPCVKEDTNLIALRYKGKAPMVGFRENDIFYILWIDFNFTLYNHS